MYEYMNVHVPFVTDVWHTWEHIYMRTYLCDVRMYGVGTWYGVPGSCSAWELLLLLHLFGVETNAGTQNK